MVKRPASPSPPPADFAPPPEVAEKRPKIEPEQEKEQPSAAALAAAAIAAQLSMINKSMAEQNRFEKKVDINSLRNRYALMKADAHEQVHAETGATVSVGGVWINDLSKAKENEVPLHLIVTAPTMEVLEKGLKKVDELINQELGPLVVDQAQQRAEWEARRPAKVKWPEEKLFVNLENIRFFQVRAKVVGPGGLFVKYIQAETGTKVQLKGKGSGFMEQETGMESNEEMHISIAGPDEAKVKEAKTLAEDLLAVVRVEHEKIRNPAAFQAQQQQAQAAAPGAVAGTDGRNPAEQEAYRAYWAAQGYDVNDPQFIQWQQQQMAAAAAAAAGGGQQHQQYQQQQQQYYQQQQQHQQQAGQYAAVPPPPGL